MITEYHFNDTWSAIVHIAAIREDLIATEGVSNPVGLFVKQAAIIGSGLWGTGSKLELGLQIDPGYMVFDVPMGVDWLTYDLDIQTTLTSPVPFFNSGVSASGDVGPVRYTLFVQDSDSNWLSPGRLKNNLAYQGIVSYKPIDSLTLTVEDMLYGATSTTSYDNWIELAATWLNEWVDVQGQLASFSHPDANVINPFGGTIGPIAATAYDLQVNFKFPGSMSGWTLFGRYMAGNPDFQNTFMGGHSSDLLFGPTYNWLAGKLGLGLLYNIQPQSDQTNANTLAENGVSTPTNQALQLRFKAMF